MVCDFLVRQQLKRKVKPVTFANFETKNILENQINNHSNCFVIQSANTEQLKNSFFVRTVVKWNQLEESTTSAKTVEAS